MSGLTIHQVPSRPPPGMGIHFSMASEQTIERVPSRPPDMANYFSMSEQTIERVPSRPPVEKAHYPTMSEQTIQRAPPVDPAMPKFWDEAMAVQRKVYLKIVIGGCVGVVIAIFAILSIYWGALWKSPVRPLQGWVVVSTRRELPPAHRDLPFLFPRILTVV